REWPELHSTLRSDTTIIAPTSIQPWLTMVRRAPYDASHAVAIYFNLTNSLIALPFHTSLSRLRSDDPEFGGCATQDSHHLLPFEFAVWGIECQRPNED